ncbi:MAG: tetratricopeptide repeat protein [Chitinophagales bacterium]|nr:tetratricopeptide repeat protein [Chitinophagales bacterium]
MLYSFIAVLFFSACKTQQKVTEKQFIAPDEISVNEISASAGNTAAADSILLERNFIDACAAKALGDYDKAIVLFKEVLKLDPENSPALYELGKIYFEYGRMDDAKELARLASTYDPANEYYQLLYGDILLYMLQYQEAAKVYENIIQKHPDKIDNYYQLAYIYDRSGNTQKSIDLLLEIRKKFGRDESALVELQRLYVKNGDISNAIEILDELIRSNPGNPSYYGMLTEVYEMTKNTALAEETFNKLLLIDPENPDLLIRRAEMEKRNGNINAYYHDLRTVFANPDASIDKKIFFLIPFVDSVDKENFVQKDSILVLTELLTQAHPNDAKGFALLGDFLYYDKKLKEARKNYRHSLSIRSDVYDVWLKVFYIDAELKQYDSLIAVTAQSIELYPNQPMGYYFNGIGLTYTDKSEEALKTYKRAIPLTAANPKLKADLYMRIGDTYNALKKYAESDEAYESSLQIDPKNPYTLNNYAYHLSERGEELEKAAEMALLANELVPGDASLLDTYAWVLYKQNKFEQAKTWIEKALKNGGDDSDVVLEHYGDILYQLGDPDAALEQWKKAKQFGTGSEHLDKKISDKKLYE